MQKIANQVGFEDIDTFARNFKKVYGIAPLKWRQEQKRIELNNKG